MARRMVATVWIDLDVDLDEDTTTEDVQHALDIALRADRQRTFPYLVEDIEVEEENDA